MRKLIVSLSLPKTGTTFLLSLLSQLACCSSPAIKEPSFFFTREDSESSLLNAILSPGNYLRGYDWYDGLFASNGQSIAIDLSTQYWLRGDEVIKRSLENYQPLFVVIKREPVAQLVSYVSHLRRGHIPDLPLSRLVSDDADFAQYLERMKTWNHDFDTMKARYPDLSFTELPFDELVLDPRSAIVSLIGSNNAVEQLDYEVRKNRMGYPVFPFLNRLLFSGGIRKFGRMMPDAIYTNLVGVRKSLVRKNLQDGKGKYHEADKIFIEEHLGQ